MVCANGYLPPDLTANKVLFNTSLSLFLIETMYYVIGLSLYLYYTPKLLWLQKRNRGMIMIMGYSCAIHNFGLSGNFARIYAFPCWIQVTLAGIMVPALLLTPMWLMFFDFYNRNIFATIILGDSKEDLTSDLHVDNNISTIACIKNALTMYWELWIKKKDKTSLGNDQALQTLRFVTSFPFRISLFFLILAPQLIFGFVEVFYVRGMPLRFQDECKPCTWSLAEFIFIISAAYIGISAVLFAGWKLRKYPDPFKIMTEIHQMVSFALVPSTAFVLYYLYPEKPTDIYTHGYFVGIGLMMAASPAFYSIYLGMILQKESAFDSQDFRTSKTIDTRVRPQSSDVKEQFKYCLNSPAELEELEGYLVQEFSSELLVAYREIVFFEDNYDTFTDTTRVARAKRIRARYFVLDAVLEVNVGAAIRNEVNNYFDELFLTNNNNAKLIHVDRNVFEKAKREIIGMLFGCYLRMIRKRKSESSSNQVAPSMQV